MKQTIFILLTCFLLLALGCEKSVEIPEKIVKLNEEKPAAEISEKATAPATKVTEQPKEEAKIQEVEVSETFSEEEITVVEESPEQEQLTSLNEETQVDFGEVV